MESGETTPINLQKLLTPASDSCELPQAKNRKMFASSYFYAPTHPTVEDQVELARRISLSLSDVKNMKSKGQSMYVNRKKRSVKWIHDGNGTEEEEEPPSMHKDKVPLKCMMNPHGKVLDIHGIQALGEEVNIEPMPSHPEKLFDIVRDLNNQRGRGAEIFAKRRKRSEKWVVDRDQPQTPSSHGIPKTMGYSQKLEMNGGSKFSSLTPTSIDQPFYNPFTVDISLDGTNVPATGRNQSCCYTNECHRATEVKKIYLREVAVGTDVDFPIDTSRSSVTEKSRRTAFDSANGRRGNNGINGAMPSTNTKRYDNKSLPGKFNTMQSATNKDIKSNVKQRHDKNYLQNVTNGQDKVKNKQRINSAPRSESEESEYTPVPVKQLIQEFEKTCRPVLQYKQISPKVIPIVQQCPIDNDIARFFETRTTTKYQEETEEYAGPSEQEDYEEPTKPQSRRTNGYVSTDDTEYTDSEDTDSQIEDYPQERPMYRCNGAPPTIMDGDQEFFTYENEYTHRRRSATSQELETFYRNGDFKFVNTDSELPVQAKSLLLSMVASQDDILDTIKHLRNTPILDNLLPGASPECKFSDVYPDVGNKLYENKEYKGPKLASVNNLTNYNTAPRGWDQSLTFYRPIKFEKSQDTIVYSDF